VAVVGQGGLGCAQVWQRAGATFDARTAFDADAPPLPGFAREPGFVF
jgi:molybdopterin/thiamine biosynthesis adenylyltransferase